MLEKQFKGLYTWTLSLAEKPWSLWALGAVAFAESSFFPIPPDLILAPLVLGAVDAGRGKAAAWWMYPLVCTLASVLGGLFGYALGALFMDGIGMQVLSTFGYVERFETFSQLLNERAFEAILIAGLTPLPYKLFTIISGASGMHLGIFLATSLFARGLRFFLVAALLRIFGAQIKALLDKHLIWISIVLAAALILVYWLLH